MIVSTTLSFSNSDDLEKAFYAAFVHCDAKAMAAIWAPGDVICVHPGAPAIVGHAAVVRSWEQIFADAQAPDLQVRVVRKSHSETLAVHVVEEHIVAGSAMTIVVLATNVYRKLDDGWRMIEHHGSVSQARTQQHTVQ